MTCHDVTSLMLAFVERRLDAGPRAEVEAHLAACAECRAAVDAQADVARVLAARPEAGVSESFAARVAARLDADTGWWGVVDWRWLTVRVAPVAAALLVAAGVVVERGASSATATGSTVTLSEVVESWAGGEGDRTPAASVLWKQDVTGDSMLMTVLTSPADASIGGQSDER